ncbi:integrase [Oxalobacteraceae bacterium GrIS 2.11]
MPLTVKSIENAKPSEKPYKLTDGNALYLYIAPTGTKIWRANFNLKGKQQTVTYGRYPDLSLAEVRKLHVIRKSESAKERVPTFEEIFEKWLVVKLPSLSNSKHQLQVERTVREHVLPDIGKLPINEIPRTLLVEVVKKLSDTPETASRVAGRIDMVFNYALDIGIIDSHGAARLSRVLPKKKSKPMPCIPQTEAGQLLKSIMTYNEPVTRLGLLMVAHTFVRFNEIQGMRWNELIMSDKVWLIPAERMKMRLPHVVPLSESTLKILEELKQYSDGNGLVIESPIKVGRPVSENTLLFALYRLGYRGRMSVHGFRSLASSVLNEHSPFDGDVIERQLAHSETNAIRAAYNRAEYLPQRRELMNWWSHWLDEQYNFQCPTPAND